MRTDQWTAKTIGQTLGLLSELCPGIGGASPLPSERLPYLQKLVLASNRKLTGCVSFGALATIGADTSAKTRQGVNFCQFRSQPPGA